MWPNKFVCSRKYVQVPLLIHAILWNAIPHTFQLQMYHTTTHTIHILHQRLFIGMGGKCIVFIYKVVKRPDNPIQAA
jgi:hypothetical protein